MKKTYKLISLLLLPATLFLTTACGEEGEEEYDMPAISIASPAVPAGGIETTVGATVSFTIDVAAEAGLSSLTADGTTVKTFAGTETSEQVMYDYLALEEGNITLSFVVEDAMAQKTSLDVALVVAAGEDLGYLLIDFAGESTASETKTIVDWDVRTLYTFNVSGSHGSSATAEIANNQGALSFAVDNPDAAAGGKVLKIEKIVEAGRDDWGGWAHLMFDLGSVIPQATIDALPTWDNTNTTLVPGTKVIKIDAYYDATVDGAFDWATLIALTDIWNADPSKGYKFDLALASYDPMGTAENGHDGSFYIGYEAYLSAPNTWETLTFDAADLGRVGNFYGVAEEAPGSDVIDCVKLMPSPGYSAADTNPVYLKNLRIVDVE